MSEELCGCGNKPIGKEFRSNVWKLVCKKCASKTTLSLRAGERKEAWQTVWERFEEEVM
jgi:hypothetical protein